MVNKKKTQKYVVCWNTGDGDPWAECDGIEGVRDKIDDLLSDGSGVTLTDITVFKVEQTLTPQITLKEE